MNYQIFIFASLGVSVLMNCLCCYSNYKKKKLLKKIQQRKKLLELSTITSNFSEKITTNDLPLWVINEYLENKSSLSI